MRAKKHGTKSGLGAAWEKLATETKIMRNLATLTAAAALAAVFGFVGAAQADKPIGGLHCGGTQAHPCPGEGKFYEMNFGFGTRGGGIIGLLLLVAAIWAIVNIAQSGASIGTKALWIVFVLVLPLVGFLAWLVAGPRAR